jgi:hypothetical protein
MGNTERLKYVQSQSIKCKVANIQRVIHVKIAKILQAPHKFRSAVACDRLAEVVNFTGFIV